jgi:translation initiation factor IF-2
MVNENDQENCGKRKTISLKSSVNVGSRRSNSVGRTVEVEIKRKRSGLAIVSGEQNSGNHNPFGDNNIGTGDPRLSPGDLTERELKVRVDALREAMKKDESSENSQQLPNASVDVSEVEAPVLEVKNVESFASTVPEKTEPSSYQQKAKKLSNAEIIANSKPVVFRIYESQDQKKPTSSIVDNNELQNIKTVPIENTSKIRTNKDAVDTDFSKKKSKPSTKNGYSDKLDVVKKKVSRTVLNRVLNHDSEGRARSMASIMRAKVKQKNANQVIDTVRVVREVNIPDSITVRELANRMAVKSAEVIKYLMSIGMTETVNQKIDGDTAEIICEEFGQTPKRVSESDIENEISSIDDDIFESLEIRPPIVAIMGHVDHGKTTLLDTLKDTCVAKKEAGGITQGVAAYQIKTKSGKKITLIDTPGHAAFSKMRARGAVITDIIVLVIAADDGVKEQTIEVIHQAKAQKVPLIVAINKIDKPSTNIQKLKSELMTHDVILEDFEGDVLSVGISALKNENLDGLLDMVLLQSEMMELKASKNRKAVGTVLESRIVKGLGITASVVIQHGTLSCGDIFVAGGAYGKIRNIYDSRGDKVDNATPADPVEIVGFNSMPEPGDVLSVLDNEQKAKEIAAYRRRMVVGSSVRNMSTRSIDSLMNSEDNEVSSVNVYIKADVFGSIEAIIASVETIRHSDIRINVVDKGIGFISESDVDFAKNTGAIIIGFNTNSTVAAKNLAKLNGVKILHHNVVYRITEELKNIMASMLSPIVEERYSGTADVRKIFFISRIGTIAGCCVVDGIVKRNDSKIMVMRNGKCVFEGKIKSMRHEKDEIKDAKQAHECGIVVDGFNDFVEGDQIECYEIVLKARSVD